MTKASDLTLVEFTDPKTVRLISTAHIDEPAMAPLADNNEDLAILEEIEGMTSARMSVTFPMPDGIHPGELLTEAAGYGWTLVNAAFCYTHTTGNRFNGPERGAWYATYGELAVETAQAEVSWHLTRELEATGRVREHYVVPGSACGIHVAISSRWRNHRGRHLEPGPCSRVPCRTASGTRCSEFQRKWHTLPVGSPRLWPVSCGASSTFGAVHTTGCNLGFCLGGRTRTDIAVRQEKTGGGNWRNHALLSIHWHNYNNVF